MSTIGGELLASGSTLLPIKRQRIPRTMPLRIEDADWGTSLSRLRYQLQDYSPLYPDGLSSESSDSGDDEEGSSSSEPVEMTTACTTAARDLHPRSAAAPGTTTAAPGATTAAPGTTTAAPGATTASSSTAPGTQTEGTQPDSMWQHTDESIDGQPLSQTLSSQTNLRECPVSSDGGGERAVRPRLGHVLARS